MKKTIFTILFLLILLNIANANQVAWLDEKNIAGKILPDSQPVVGQILDDAKSINLLSSSWSITYDRYVLYELDVPRTSDYLIVVLSDDERIGLTLINSSANVIDVGKGHELRNYKKSMRIPEYPDGNSEGILTLNRNIRTSYRFNFY